MTTNVGTPDRVFRIVLGIVLLSLLYFLEGNAHWFGLIGLRPDPAGDGSLSLVSCLQPDRLEQRALVVR